MPSGLARPTLIKVGTGQCAENGILIKGGEHLEKAHELNAIVLDKTGTITKGEPSLTDVITIDKGISEDELIRLVASAERGSEHPLGEAIVKGARERGIELAEPQEFEAIPGHGIASRIGENIVLIGNRRADVFTKYRYIQTGKRGGCSGGGSDGLSLLLGVRGRATGMVAYAGSRKTDVSVRHHS